MTGNTRSTDFPITSGAFQTSKGDTNIFAVDAFVTKLNALGSALMYSTYLGGSDSDQIEGIAVDSSGSAYVAGWTFSSDFPTANPIQGAKAGGPDAFTAKLDATGATLAYSTYLGGILMISAMQLLSTDPAAPMSRAPAARRTFLWSTLSITLRTTRSSTPP